ncbi:MAG: asparagine synthase (glutamine-hydrolyzing) [Patescibacteria group bacterium]|nr:asparagine synthase (glutamine-hydrolyzing) [Patescibacteria group bacterium]
MCGIFGLVASDFNTEDLKEATRTITHRGPDAEGFFMDSSDSFNVCLGHRRLSIIDLTENANQPFFSSDGRYVMVYNGEIYNFKELRIKYNLTTRTKSDTEVIIELFARYGESIVRELNGMFAFVVFDQIEKIIYAFRDRFGVKPFFYYWDNSTFVFASEIKAILKALRYPPQTDMSALGYYLTLGFIPAPITIYKKIFKLEPGHRIVYDIKKQNFFFSPYVNLSEFISQKTEEDSDNIVEKVESLLLKSVERQIISDVPIGIFLSGGIDSSLLTALVREVSEEKVKTFTLGFSDSQFDEIRYARKIAKHLDTDHHELVVSGQDLINNLDFVLQSYDEPYIISAGFSAFALSEFCRRYVKVALSGEGADELFLGYGFYNWAKRLHTFPFRPFAAMMYKVLSLSPDSYIRHKADLLKLPKDYEQQHIFTQEQFYFSRKDLTKNFSPDVFVSDFKHSNVSYPATRLFNSVEKQSWFDIHKYLVDDLLTKIDRASMAYSLEVRVPYLDNDLFNYVINIHSRFRMKGNQTKYILKKIIEKYIPKELTERQKWGFAPPIRNWLKKELKFMINDYLSEKMIKRYGIVNYEYVEELKNKFQQGHEYIFNKLWLLILLHKWLEDRK